MKWYEMICTWFGLGKSSFMPGTIGSLGAYPLFYLSVMSSSTAHEAKMTMLFFVLVLCVVGYIAIRYYHKKTGFIDHQSIVVDEVIGQLTTLALAYEWIGHTLVNLSLLPPNASDNTTLFYIFLAAFLPFRFFDITKPFYISLIDRYWKNAVGVILDDILAGIAAASIFFILK
jgi:phosphatidylglycerophosphatase A